MVCNKTGRLRLVDFSACNNPTVPGTPEYMPPEACDDGSLTIGYGHRVVDSDPYEEGVEYPKEVLEQQFEKDFLVYLYAAERYIGKCEVPEVIKDCVIEIAYNIGEPKLFQFVKMRQAMQDGDFVEMGEQLKDSRLYRTLTSRYEPIVKLIQEA